MKRRLFEIFAETIDNLPVEGISRVVALEQQMLEDDLMEQRILDDEQVESILAFCRFLKAIQNHSGNGYHSVKLPVVHVAYYRSILERLIHAGELPREALTKFDTTVASDFEKFVNGN